MRIMEEIILWWDGPMIQTDTEKGGQEAAMKHQ